MSATSSASSWRPGRPRAATWTSMCGLTRRRISSTASMSVCARCWPRRNCSAGPFRTCTTCAISTLSVWRPRCAWARKAPSATAPSLSWTNSRGRWMSFPASRHSGAASTTWTSAARMYTISLRPEPCRATMLPYGTARPATRTRIPRATSEAMSTSRCCRSSGRLTSCATIARSTPGKSRGRPGWRKTRLR